MLLKFRSKDLYIFKEYALFYVISYIKVVFLIDQRRLLKDAFKEWDGNFSFSDI